MALTYSRVASLVNGNSKVTLVDFTADATYAAGGYTLAQADFEKMTGSVDVQTTTSIRFFDSEVNAGGYSLSLDRANSKLKYFLGGTEATTTVSSTVVRARIVHSLGNAK